MDRGPVRRQAPWFLHARVVPEVEGRQRTDIQGPALSRPAPNSSLPLSRTPGCSAPSERTAGRATEATGNLIETVCSQGTISLTVVCKEFS